MSGATARDNADFAVQVQRWLIGRGHPLSPDGWAGPATALAFAQETGSPVPQVAQPASTRHGLAKSGLPSGVLDDLRHDEGWRESPYRDTLSYVTIGYGFLIDERKPVKLPRAVGDVWLEHVAAEKWSELVARRPWIAEQPEDVQRALANLCYQLGVSGLLKFQRMLGALERGDRKAAADYAMQSLWSKQTPGRAARVASLIRGAAVPANEGAATEISAPGGGK